MFIRKLSTMCALLVGLVVYSMSAAAAMSSYIKFPDIEGERTGLLVQRWDWLTAGGEPTEGRPGQVAVMVAADWVEGQQLRGQRVKLSLPHRVQTSAGETHQYQWELENCYVSSYNISGAGTARIVVRYGSATLTRGR